MAKPPKTPLKKVSKTLSPKQTLTKHIETLKASNTYLNKLYVRDQEVISRLRRQEKPKTIAIIVLIMVLFGLCLFLFGCNNTTNTTTIDVVIVEDCNVSATLGD